MSSIKPPTSAASRRSEISPQPTVSTVVGTRDLEERFVPENEASSEEEEIGEPRRPDDPPALSCVAYVQGQGAGYTKCDISGLYFTREQTLHQFRLLSHLNISNFKGLEGGCLDGLVSALPNLTVLYANNCGLTTIVGVDFNPGLRILSLANNSIAALPVFTDQFYLETIDLSENRLDALFSQVYETCYSLREINVAGNEITVADLSCFGECLALQAINVANNALTDKGTIWPCDPLKQVAYLNLKGNRFHEIPGQVAEVFPGLFSFDISKNEIKISAEMNISALASLEYLYEFNVCEPHEIDMTTRSLIIFYLQQLKKINSVDVSAEDKVNVESIFNPSIQQKARSDHITQELDDLRQHKTSVPITCLPNMEAYPVFVFTGPSLSLRTHVKQMVQQAESYLPILRRINPILDASSDFTQTYYEYICYDRADFQALEAAGKFAAVGHDLADNINYAFARELVDQNCNEGFGTICEMPVTGALSLHLSEKYRPQVILVLPAEDDYRLAVEAKFGNDPVVAARLLEEYDSIRQIHAEQLGLFRIVVTPEDTDVLVNYLYVLLEGNMGIGQRPDIAATRSQDSSKMSATSDAWSSTASRTSSARPSRTSVKVKMTEAILPADTAARRASLVQQARRRTVGTANARRASRSATVGANMIFDLSKDTMARRTVQAINAICSDKTQGHVEKGSAETLGAMVDRFLVETDESLCQPDDEMASMSTGFQGMPANSATPDWEAEGIIVLPDDATTLSNCQSARQASSAGVSTRNASAKTNSTLHSSKKSVLPAI